MTQAKHSNLWPSARCAKAFWGQQDLPPYQRLLADTLEWADPGPRERWLDLGSGGGAITRAIWERTSGAIDSVIALDCAAVNEESYRRLRESLQPAPADHIRFIHHDFSGGLGLFPSAAFDHAVSGLSISYAEDFDETAGKWTTKAYDRVLTEVWRVIRPGGRFVFSVNVPEPSWAKVAWRSLPSMFAQKHLARAVKRSFRMLWYGRWLKQEARVGRFHYLPADEVMQKLAEAGFTSISHRLSYCDQAYVFRAVKPG